MQKYSDTIILLFLALLSTYILLHGLAIAKSLVAIAVLFMTVTPFVVVFWAATIISIRMSE